MYAINEMKNIVKHMDHEVHRKHCESLIKEVERLQKIIDDGIPAKDGMQYVAVKIPEDYELACKEMRAPKEGEYFISKDGKDEIIKAVVDADVCATRVILRKIPIAPEGYEFTGEFRVPNIGEYILINDHASQQNSVTGFDEPHRILRKKWQWPEFLTVPYIAHLQNGCWVWFKSKPTWNNNYYENSQGVLTALFYTTNIVFPPLSDDAKDSLMKNPHRKDLE